jgi:hypothetical protein
MANTSTNSQGKNYTVTILFAIGLLLFLAPFVEFKINTGIVGGFAWRFTGTDLLTGQRGKTTGPKLDDDFSVTSSGGFEDMNYYVLAAIIFALIGLLLSFAGRRKPSAGIMGILSALALIGLFIDIKQDFGKVTGGDADFFGTGVALDFTPWFFISLLSFIAAAIISFRRSKAHSPAETPPKNAPQLPIENPGDQSEFPKAASESEIG